MITEVKMVKSDREQMIELLAMIVSLSIFYLSINPNALDSTKTRLRHARDTALYRLSIWRARRAIQSLPEIDL